MVLENMLPLAIVVGPLIIALLSFAAGKIDRRMRDGLVFAASAGALAGVVILIRRVLQGNIYTFRTYGLLFRVDEMSVILAFVTATLWLTSIVYSAKYMEGKNNPDRYYASLLLTLAGCLGVAFSGGIMELFIFFEMASLVPYVLILHSHSSQAHKAASKYLYMSIIGGFLMFYGVVVTYWVKETGDFSVIGSGEALPVTALVAFLIGFGIKGGIVPLHSWLPDAHSVSPSSVSSLLSGITVKVGMFGIIKLVYYISPAHFTENSVWVDVLLWMAVISIMLGSIVAIGQKRIKRMLAYSTISQMGYILLGIALMTHRGLVGALYHFFAHSLMKGSLFLIAGAIKHKKDIVYLEDFRGLGREMPVTMMCYTVAALSMVGIPLFSGFTSKWYLGLGSLDAGKPFYLGVLLLSSLLNVIYFFPPAINAFFPKDTVHNKKGALKMNELHPLMLVPIMVLIAGVIYGGIFDNFMLELASKAAARIMIR